MAPVRRTPDVIIFFAISLKTSRRVSSVLIAMTVLDSSLALLTARNALGRASAKTAGERPSGYKHKSTAPSFSRMVATLRVLARKREVTR